MKSFSSLLVLVSLVVFTACAPAGETEAERQAAIQADIDALNQLRSDYQAAYNAQDAPGVASLYTEDAVISLPNQAPATGRDAIQSALQTLFDHYEVQLSISSEEMQVPGDWAFDAGTTTQTFTPKEEGEARELHSSYIVILKRQADGSWKLARVVVSSNDPLPGSGG